jgi:GWxTD domain-containing protein
MRDVMQRIFTVQGLKIGLIFGISIPVLTLLSTPCHSTPCFVQDDYFCVSLHIMRTYSLLFLLLIGELASGTTNRLSAYFTYATFDTPGGRPYLETYLQVGGPTVTFARLADGKYEGILEVKWIYSQEGKIVSFDKYLLHSPKYDSLGLSSPADFLDVQRTPLDSGKYDLQLTITDVNDTAQSYTIRQEVMVNFPKDRVSVSDIELLEGYRPSKNPGTFTKNGYDIYPYALGYYPAEVNRLLFYTEIYRTADFAGGDVLIRYLISNKESKLLVGDLAGNKKQAGAAVIPLLAELPIDQLASGNYQLTVEVRSRENKVLAYRQCFFQRINPITKPIRQEDLESVDANGTFVSFFGNADTLKEYIGSMYPLFNSLEGRIAEHQMQLSDVNGMQQFLYYYWSKKNPADPEAAWIAYRKEVAKVNANYGTRSQKGYETDRGRVYLKYGPPNTIVKDYQDPESYPYEIWHFYRIGSQTNRRFVFYSTDISNNSFRLLHSDTRGEVQDMNWELKLHSRSQAFGADIDQEKAYDIYGSRTKENFNFPR